MNKTYQSLTRRYYEQPAANVFGFFPFYKDSGETWETPYEDLVSMAKQEEWNFV